MTQSIKKLLAMCSVLLGTMPWAWAADKYPDRPVKIIVAFQAGQATDQAARIFAQKLTEMFGQSFYVENRPGAASIIGTEMAAKAPPDGYTLLMGSSGSLAVNPGLYRKLPYDPVRDFVPISRMLIVPFFLAVTPDFPAENLKDLVQYLKTRPGQIDFASAGNGASNHLSTELFMSTTGVRMNHIPYKSSPAAVTDLLGGRIPLMFDTGPVLLPYVKAGKLRAIAVGSASRQSATPELPTIAESGYPGFEAVGWAGLVAPAGTPKEIIDQLNAAIRKIAAEPGFRDKLIGAELEATSSEEYGAYIKSEGRKWADVIKRSGAELQD